VREYLVSQEISYGGQLSDARLTKLTDALLDVENCDGAITEADVAGKLGTGDMEVQMIVTALDPAEAAARATPTAGHRRAPRRPARRRPAC
jgi:hypothetical protein